MTQGIKLFSSALFVKHIPTAESLKAKRKKNGQEKKKKKKIK
jgi:hypothetical protein